jgi:hypothetical protein
MLFVGFNEQTGSCMSGSIGSDESIYRQAVRPPAFSLAGRRSRNDRTPRAPAQAPRDRQPGSYSSDCSAMKSVRPLKNTLNAIFSPTFRVFTAASSFFGSSIFWKLPSAWRLYCSSTMPS